MTNHISTHWIGGMAFKSNNPSGIDLKIDAGPEDGGEGKGYRPKALMLTSLAGCSGLDVVALFDKMKLDVDKFHIEIFAELTDEHPKYYHKVHLEYHFYGKALDEKKLQRAVDLSVDKYCGVMEMFRRFAEVTTENIYHKE